MQRTVIDDRYVLGDPLGGGGMAAVYLAHDEVLGRDVAVKVLREEYAHDPEFVERFRREARNAASLSHPNIVPVYDRGETQDGTYYIAMEHLPGGTLKDYVRKNGPLDPERAAAVAAQVAEALSAAHGRGVVHRDIKPQNVLVTASGDVKVADFGIARAASATALSRTDFVVGTVNYMSPEQAMGETATPASDLYSLGVVLYEMLTGELPFEADTQVGVAMKHINEPPRPPHEVNPEVPELMSAVVMKLLAKKPEDRYADAAELIEDLDRVQNGFPPTVADVRAGAGAGERETEKVAAVLPERVWRSRRRSPRRLLALVALLPLLLGAGLVLWRVLGDPGVVGFLDGPPGPGGKPGGPSDMLEEARQFVGIGKGEVPDVEGMTVEAARQRLEDAGFQVGVRPRESSEAEIGRVLEQSVPGGREEKLRSTILLAVGRGPDVSVPDLSGLPLADAKGALKEAGLAPGDVKEAPSTTVAAGGIVAQDPAAGTKTAPDTTVGLTVSSGPEQAASGSASGSRQAPPQPPQPAASGNPVSGSGASVTPPSNGAAGTSAGASPAPAATTPYPSGTPSGAGPVAGPSTTADGAADTSGTNAGESQVPATTTPSPTGTPSGAEPTAGPSTDPDTAGGTVAGGAAPPIPPPPVVDDDGGAASTQYGN